MGHKISQTLPKVWKHDNGRHYQPHPIEQKQKVQGQLSSKDLLWTGRYHGSGMDALAATQRTTWTSSPPPPTHTPTPTEQKQKVHRPIEHAKAPSRITTSDASPPFRGGACNTFHGVHKIVPAKNKAVDQERNQAPPPRPQSRKTEPLPRQILTNPTKAPGKLRTRLPLNLEPKTPKTKTLNPRP